MRVLQVVTLVSPDGAYGGPVRVAFNQSAQLRADGAEVMVCGGTRGYDVAPRAISETPVRLFRVVQVIPGSGFAGLCSPGLVLWFLFHARRFDVIHVHLARDLVTAVIAGLAILLRVDLHVQTHGMIDSTSRRLARPLDTFLVRPVLRRAASVFYLTPRERDDLLKVESSAELTELINGVPTGPDTVRPAAGQRLRVLYLARLQARKRPEVFVAAAIELLDAGFPGEFVLVGPDEGAGPEVSAMIDASGHDEWLRWTGAVDPDGVIAHLQDADLYVLPSVNEPFPMSVLEAMAAGLPVVVTESNGLATAVRDANAGTVIDESLASLVDAIRSYGDDRELTRIRGARARTLVTESYSMAAVVARLRARYVATGTADAQVGWLDVAFTGTYVFVAVGPVALGDASAIRAAIRALPTADARARAHLRPTWRSRRWALGAEQAVTVRSSVPEAFGSEWVSASGAAERLALFERISTEDDPLSVLLDGEYAYVRIDHGLGDATFSFDVVTAVATSGTPVRPVTEPLPEVTSGVLRNLAVVPGGGIPALMKGAVGAIRRRPAEEPVTVSPPAGLQVVAHRFAPTARRSSRLGAPTASSNSVVCHAIVQGCVEAGVALAPTAAFLVDLRRYAPDVRSAGNLSSVIELPLSEIGSPMRIDAAMRAELASRVPLLRAAAAATKAMMNARFGRRSARTDGGAAKLVISNVSRHPSAAGIWANATGPQRDLLAATVPSGSRQISVFVTSLGPAFEVTAAFRDGAVPPDVMRAALRNAEQRVHAWYGGVDDAVTVEETVAG